MKKIFVAFAVLLIINSSFAQKEYYKWYFGNQAAMDFVSGAPVNITGSNMVATDNPATVSDATGNLLFYSNGLKVWNKNNMVMPNGNGLLGNLSGGYSATVVRQPGSSNL